MVSVGLVSARENYESALDRKENLLNLTLKRACYPIDECLVDYIFEFDSGVHFVLVMVEVNLIRIAIKYAIRVHANSGESDV